MGAQIDIPSLANYGLKILSQNNNIKAGELYFSKSEFINIDIDENSVKNTESGEDQGVSVRLIDKRGSLGFSFTNRITMKKIEQMTDEEYQRYFELHRY